MNVGARCTPGAGKHVVTGGCARMWCDGGRLTAVVRVDPSHPTVESFTFMALGALGGDPP